MASPEEREAAAAAQAVADDDALRDALSDMALHFEFSAESHLFSLGFKLPEEAKFAEGFRLFVSACDGVVKLVATCSYRVPAPARPLVGRALLALTNAIPQGSMDMDWDDGELRFRVSWPNIAGARLQPLVKHAVRIGCAAYAVGILAVHEKISQYAAAQAAGSPLPPTDDAAMAEWAGRVATAISEEAYKSPAVALDVAISRSSSVTHTINVRTGDVVRWGFTVADGYDVAFSVEAPGRSGAVQAAVRVSADMGSLRAESDGKLELIFDNSFSLLRGKTVRLRTLIGPPELTLDAVRADGIFDPETACALVMHGMDLFFTNRFSEADRFFSAFADTVPIFSLSLGAVSFMRGVMTWAPEELAMAQERLKATQKLCQTVMPQESWIGSIFGSGAPAGSVTPAQLDATVICGEATLLGGLLFLTEESLMGIVRFAMAVRSGWKHYVTADRLVGGLASAIGEGPALVPAARIADAASATTATAAAGGAGSAAATAAGTGVGAVVLDPIPSMSSDPGEIYGLEACAAFPRLSRHLLGGLLFGTGTFNCVASVLPPVAVRIIAALGFPCDREAGLEQLRRCLRKWNVRSPLAAMFLLMMRVLFPSFASTDMADNIPEAEAVLQAVFAKYPDSAMFLWMAGRLARMQGHVALARERLSRCTGLELVQFSQLASYELAWSYAFLLDWPQVDAIFGRLLVDNEWSKAFYAQMQAAALLQLGRVAEARIALKRCMRLFGRRLGGKVISAEQYALRRAAEFVSLTYVAADDLAAAGVADDIPDESVLPAGVLASMPRLRVPAVVRRGSRAHAGVLAYGAPLLGLESIYLFNGATQMDAVACAAAIAQVDAVLATAAAGHVFDAASALWQGTATASAWGDAETCWVDAHAEESSSAAAAGSATGSGSTPPVTTPEGITALLNSVVRAPVGSLSSAGDGEASSALSSASSAAGSSSAAASARSRGSVFGGLFGRSSTSSAGGDGASPTAAGSAAPAATAAALPDFAKPTPLQPLHTAAIAALVRGSLCSRVGRIDEAAACFRWVVETGPALLKRDLHVYAYAAYELGVLYADAVKAMQRRAAGVPPPATSHSGADILSAALFRGMSPKDAAAAAKRYMAAGRDVKDDFNWKLRLHMRVHLSADDLRASSGKKSTRRVLGGGAAAAAGGAGAGGAGAAKTPEEAARFEADLLAAAEGPIGGGSADDDDLGDD